MGTATFGWLSNGLFPRGHPARYALALKHRPLSPRPLACGELQAGHCGDKASECLPDSSERCTVSAGAGTTPPNVAGHRL